MTTPYRWIIGLPVWGDRYVDLARNVSLPCITAALNRSKLPAHLVIHTDLPPEAFGTHTRFSLEFRPIKHRGWHQYSLAHFDVCRLAMPGDFVSLLPADAAISREFFTFCETRLAAGMTLVAAEGSRTYAEEYPPIGVSGQELTDWSIEHLHQCMRDCFWGTGRTLIHSTIYFADGDNLVKHCFHVGPMGFVVDGRQYKLGGDSSDGSFMDSFRSEEVHVAQPSELAIIECSPEEKSFGIRPEPFTHQHVVEWAKGNATPNHCATFRQPIVLQGVDTGKSRYPVSRILAALGHP